MNNNYTILVICEGERTEPLFFISIKDHILEQRENEQTLNIQLTVAPEPRVDEDDEKDSQKSVRHKANRKTRKSKPVESIDKIEIVKGKPPLRWVQTAIRELKSGAYHEVWAVFDNDDHPAKEEAFEAAKEVVDGRKINIAYSSRSFEQYLLTHFERSTKLFQKTDCKHKIGENSYSNQCGTNAYPKLDCKGAKCINGYAATRGYWKNSKQDNSKRSNTFLLIKDKLDIGFENSSWLRYKIKNSTLPIYQKTPYTDVDILVKKLMNHDICYEWIDHNIEYDFECVNVIYDSIEKTLSIQNVSQVTKIIEENILTIYTPTGSNSIGDRCVLYPEQRTSINLTNHIGSANYFKISLTKHIILFEK